MSEKLRQLGAKLTSDKKKLSVSIVLVVMLLLLWGRLLLNRAPRTAVADPEATATEPAAPTAGAGLPTKYYQMVYVDLPETVERDLFRFEISRYRSDWSPEDGSGQGKSPPKSPDNELEIQKIRQWADSLMLQAAVLGDEPKVMINDRIYRLGDRINGFVVETVESRSATLVKDDVAIRLEMGD